MLEKADKGISWYILGKYTVLMPIEDCHLMVSAPEQWVEDFAKAGANGYTFHIEATSMVSLF